MASEFDTGKYKSARVHRRSSAKHAQSAAYGKGGHDTDAHGQIGPEELATLIAINAKLHPTGLLPLKLILAGRTIVGNISKLPLNKIDFKEVDLSSCYIAPPWQGHLHGTPAKYPEHWRPSPRTL